MEEPERIERERYGAEVSEQMDVIPEQVRVLQHHRIKYACPCNLTT
ncbi:transposase [Variovorax paradoxus]|nr:transposase [Variovorax paradoxus]